MKFFTLKAELDANKKKNDVGVPLKSFERLVQQINAAEIQLTRPMRLIFLLGPTSDSSKYSSKAAEEKTTYIFVDVSLTEAEAINISDPVFFLLQILYHVPLDVDFWPFTRYRYPDLRDNNKSFWGLRGFGLSRVQTQRGFKLALGSPRPRDAILPPYVKYQIRETSLWSKDEIEPHPTLYLALNLMRYHYGDAYLRFAFPEDFASRNYEEKKLIIEEMTYLRLLLESANVDFDDYLSSKYLNRKLNLNMNFRFSPGHGLNLGEWLERLNQLQLP